MFDKQGKFLFHINFLSALLMHNDKSSSHQLRVNLIMMNFPRKCFSQRSVEREKTSEIFHSFSSRFSTKINSSQSVTFKVFRC